MMTFLMDSSDRIFPIFDSFFSALTISSSSNPCSACSLTSLG